MVCNNSQPQKWILGDIYWALQLWAVLHRKCSLGTMEHKSGSKPALLPGTSSGKNCSILNLVCVLGTSHSLIPLQGRVGAFDLLFSFWGAVCHVQGTHVAPRHAKFRRFCVLSWWNLLSVLEGTPWVCVQYSSNIVESWDGQAGPSKNSNSTVVQRRKIPACQSLKKLVMKDKKKKKKSSKTR